MKARYILLAATGALILFTAPAYPHDVQNMESGRQKPTRVTRRAQR